MRHEKYDFFRSIDKFLGSKPTQNYFWSHKLLLKNSNFRPKKEEKIYAVSDNQIKFTYVCIFTENNLLGDNHSKLHFIMFKKLAIANETSKKKFLIGRHEKCN